MPKALIIPLLISTLLTACANIPELEDAVSPAVQNSRFPELIDQNVILAEADAGQEESLATSETLVERAEDLQSRAAKLRQDPLIDASTKQRMEEALLRPPT
ncbi:MAG: hypothetical protein ACU0CA_15060 [Paracoccaceae bacterium]